MLFRSDTADYSKLVMVKVKVEETTKDPNHFDAAIYVRNVTEMADSDEMEEEEMFYYDDYLAELASGDNVTASLSDYELAKPVIDIDVRVGNTTISVPYPASPVTYDLGSGDYDIGEGFIPDVGNDTFSQDIQIEARMSSLSGWQAAARGVQMGAWFLVILSK